MHDLDGRIPLLPEGKTLVSAHTYNRLAKVLRNIYSESLQIGVAPNGGLRLEIDSQPIGEGGGGDGVLAYAGPFLLTSAGVAAGKALIHLGKTFDKYVIVDCPATSYGNMVNTQSLTSGVVWLTVWETITTAQASSWNYGYSILPRGTMPESQFDIWGGDHFFVAIGAFDSNSSTYEQWHTGYAELFGGAGYTGPFRLYYDSTNSTLGVTQGKIYAGITTVPLLDSYVNYPGGNCWVVLTVSVSGTTLSVALSISTTANLTQTDTEYKVLIGRFDGRDVEQIQHGDIYIAGRAV